MILLFILTVILCSSHWPYLKYRHHDAAQFSGNTAGNDLAKLYNTQPGSIPFDAFDSEEHKRNLDLLLSQERVVSLIYAKTFPIVSKSSSAKGSGTRTSSTLTSMNAKIARQQQQQQQQHQAGGPASPTTGGDAADLFDTEDPALLNRPLTANAILSSIAANANNLRSDKFPPIAPNNLPANRTRSS